MFAVLQYSQTLCAEEHSRYRQSNMAGCQLSFIFDWFNDRKYILALNWNVKSLSVSKINRKRYSVWTWKEITRCLNSCVSCWIQFGSRSAVIYIFILVAQRRNECELKIGQLMWYLPHGKAHKARATRRNMGWFMINFSKPGEQTPYSRQRLLVTNNFLLCLPPWIQKLKIMSLEAITPMP